jgi:hypothetical protein
MFKPRKSKIVSAPNGILKQVANFFSIDAFAEYLSENKSK